jgi:uncharacterized protein (TIGR03067 family)
MKTVWACAGLLLLPLAVLAGEPRTGAANLEGTYKIVSGESDGKPVPKDKIEGSITVIGKDKIVGTDKDKKEFFACTYRLDTGKKPYVITMTSTTPKKGEKARGVIEKDGDTLRICYALPGAPVPTTFKTVKGQNSFVLKKVEK